MVTAPERYATRGDLSGVVTVLGALDRRPWTEQAACAGSEAQWISDLGGGKDCPATVVPLLEICGNCPVRRDCLLDAIDTDGGVELYGVWGGTTMTERRAARTAIGTVGTDAWTYPRTHAVTEIVDTFEATLAERLALWRARLRSIDMV